MQQCLDYILNGRGFGSVADRLMAVNMDPRALRPYIGKDGRSYVDVVVNGQLKALVTNAPATLPKDAWKLLDRSMARVARKRLRLWADLVAAGLRFNLPNGMGHTVLQGQTMGDAGNATFSMDGLRKSERDRPEFDITNLPLPIVHSDFSFSLREIMVSRNGGAPLDTTMAEMSTRKCVEAVEQLTLGVSTGPASSYTYGGGTVYGLTNYPDRVTTTMTLPTAAGWSPRIFFQEILGLIDLFIAQDFYGPWGIYISRGWKRYMDDDYSEAYNGSSLRSRIQQIEDISFVRTSDYLPGFQVLLVSMNSDTIQAITGMQLTTLEWDSHGGLQKNFKVMGIMVPRIRSNSNGDTGIVHATAA